MEKLFREKKFEQGAITGIEEVAQLLRKHFPHPSGHANEISDKPIILWVNATHKNPNIIK